MYTLCLQQGFTAGHYLIGGEWGSENHPHSHTYRVEVRLAAHELDPHGYVADLVELEPILDSCVAHYRDRLLNELPEFHEMNPSIERLARQFCERLLQGLGSHAFSTVEIRIWENEMAWASYRESFS